MLLDEHSRGSIVSYLEKLVLGVLSVSLQYVCQLSSSLESRLSHTYGAATFNLTGWKAWPGRTAFVIAKTHCSCLLGIHEMSWTLLLSTTRMMLVNIVCTSQHSDCFKQHHLEVCSACFPYLLFLSCIADPVQYP